MPLATDHIDLPQNIVIPQTDAKQNTVHGDIAADGPDLSLDFPSNLEHPIRRYELRSHVIKLSTSDDDLALIRNDGPEGNFILHSSLDEAFSLEEEESIEIQAEGLNPARLPPRYYVTIKDARMAIREEVYGLLRPSSVGIAPLRLVNYASEEYRKIPRINTTMLAKIKAGKKYKARMFTRRSGASRADVILECPDSKS